MRGANSLLKELKHRPCNRVLMCESRVSKTSRSNCRNYSRYTLTNTFVGLGITPLCASPLFVAACCYVQCYPWEHDVLADTMFCSQQSPFSPLPLRESHLKERKKGEKKWKKEISGSGPTSMFFLPISKWILSWDIPGKISTQGSCLHSH